ncbi:MAG: zinc-ribbon domain-containing protein [Anaeroplasmataceae bacterium]|nr:zinc-ribbon domain-containing protein [Anaeroplasmataceae bacterium]
MNGFIFSTNEQKFYEEHQYLPPKRCKKCRDARKSAKQDAYYSQDNSYNK